MPLTQQQQNDLQALTTIAIQMSQACPDMREMARAVAMQLLEQHGLAELEPDRVYFHRFHSASGSPDTFNHWQHQTAPYQSLTLPQLVMARFTPAEQEASDLLDQYTGFYSNGPAHPPYDETNEIRLSPKAVMDTLWAIDFSSDFRARMTRFWQQHADHYRTLAKAMFLGKVLEVCAEGGEKTLARRALQAAQALTNVQAWPPSLALLREERLPSAAVQVRIFDIGGHVATDILRLVFEDDSQLLYIPGDDQPLQFFASDRELFSWVLAKTREASDRARFFCHFPLASLVRDGTQVGLPNLLDVMRRQWDTTRPDGLNKLDTPLQLDAFTWLRDAAHQRMIADAHYALRSNADLRKQSWIGYLQSFVRVFGPMAPLDWPIALAATGAGLAETGLDIDQAINGHTTAQRQAGVTAAILAAINTLFNASMLVAAGIDAAGRLRIVEELEPAEPAANEQQELEDATPPEMQAWVPEAFTPADTAKLLETHASNDILTTIPNGTRFTGVHLENGKFYAMVNGLTYEVRFLQELDSWAIIDPENPFSFATAIPLQTDAKGAWQPIARMGLRGGTPRFLLRAWGRLQPRPTLPPLEPTPYEVPAEQQANLLSAANGDENYALTYNHLPPYQLYRNLRDSLQADARSFFRTYAPAPRAALAPLPSTAPPKTILQTLYRHSNGLVIGESHVEAGARQFLISNMGQLKQQGVRVLYLEHIMTDFQQAELDLFNQTGTLPDRLKAFVEDFDAQANAFESTPYSLKKVLYAAHAKAVRVQGIDCLASYRQAWHEKPSLTTRQSMMNYFAHRIISIDQATRGQSKWVALVGNTHANNFMGTPGLAELQGAIGLRVEDVEIGQPRRIGTDPGLALDLDGAPVLVRSDLRLQAPITRPWM